MQRCVWAALFCLMTMTGAKAQYDRFTGNTVFLAIQCDVGRFGEVAKIAGIDPLMRAHVVYSYAVEKSQKVVASAGLSMMIDWVIKGPKLKASRTWTQTDVNTLDGNFNINIGNTAACTDGDIPRVPVGIFECLKEQTDPIKAKIVSKCEKTRTAAGNVTADGTFRWIFIEGGLEGDFDAKVTYVIKVDAPARPDAN